MLRSFVLSPYKKHMDPKIQIVAGSSNVRLAESIADFLGIPLLQTKLQYFADHEISVDIGEHVDGNHIFVIQSTCAPANDHIMELALIIDALKRASAKAITCVIPYFGYSRQDSVYPLQPLGDTEENNIISYAPVSAKLIANLLTMVGATRVLTLDLHSKQMQGFFDIPINNLLPSSVFVTDIKKKYDISSLTIVSPDIGAIARARVIANALGAPLAIVDKRRESPGVSEALRVIGDVSKRDCIIVDDIVDSASTICNAASALVNAGASSVVAHVTHGVLSSSAVESIESSVLLRLVITDSIVNQRKLHGCSKIEVISVAALIADAIKSMVAAGRA